MLKTKLLFFGIRLFVFTGLTHLQQCIMPRTCIYLSAFIYRRCDSRLVEDGYTRYRCDGRLVALPLHVHIITTTAAYRSYLLHVHIIAAMAA